MKTLIYYGNLMHIITINIILYLNAIKQLPRNELTVDIGRCCTTKLIKISGDYFTMVSVSRGVAITLPVQRWTGFDSQQGPAIFLYSTASKPNLGTTQPPIQRVPGCLTLGIKQPGSEAGRSPPCTAEVKNAGTISALPLPLWGGGFNMIIFC